MASPVELGAAPLHTAPSAADRSQNRDWRYPSTLVSLRTMRQDLRAFLMTSGLPDDVVDDLVLATCEAATNGIEHALSPTEPFFDVRAEVDGELLEVVVRDYGRWTVGPADRDDRAIDRSRGLHMMTMLAAISLTSGPRGTTVTLRNVTD